MRAFRTETQTSLRRSLALSPLALSIWLLWPAQAAARAVVRVINAAPGSGPATLTLTGSGTRAGFGTVRFAQLTSWRSIRSGRFGWTAFMRGRPPAHGSLTLGSGGYDMVMLTRSRGITLGVFRTRVTSGSHSLLRVIHAAPELGNPELRLDTRTLTRSISYATATPYVSVTAGAHVLSALSPSTTQALLPPQRLKLAPGTAYSAIVLGTGGRRLRIVTVTDRGAPLTRSSRGAERHRHEARRPALPRSTRSVLVHRGDSLWSIAAHRLGPGASNETVAREVAALWRLNAARIGTGDPNLIFPGQRIVFPAGRR